MDTSQKKSHTGRLLDLENDLAILSVHLVSFNVHKKQENGQLNNPARWRDGGEVYHLAGWWYLKCLITVDWKKFQLELVYSSCDTCILMKKGPAVLFVIPPHQIIFSCEPNHFQSLNDDFSSPYTLQLCLSVHLAKYMNKCIINKENSLLDCFFFSNNKRFFF